MQLSLALKDTLHRQFALALVVGVIMKEDQLNPLSNELEAKRILINNIRTCSQQNRLNWHQSGVQLLAI